MTLLRAIGTWLLFRLIGRRRKRAAEETEEDRIVARAHPERRAETAAILLLLAAALWAVGFVVCYALEASTQLLGITLGLSLTCIAAALIVLAHRVFATEEITETYPEPKPEAAEDVAQIVRESTDGITRKGLLIAAGSAAGCALGAAVVTPALSLGPLLDTDPLYKTPWHRGRGLVDSEGKPVLADDIEQGAFYTAFAAGASKDDLGSPLVLVRLPPHDLRLPRDRADWAPEGILAYSKICTHAGCAIALYRSPTYDQTQPDPALVCPCHYSTFNPATGGEVVFGPAGRPLPQLPLLIGSGRELRSAGNFSGPIGPSWSGVRSRRPT